MNLNHTQILASSEDDEEDEPCSAKQAHGAAEPDKDEGGGCVRGDGTHLQAMKKVRLEDEAGFVALPRQLRAQLRARPQRLSGAAMGVERKDVAVLPLLSTPSLSAPRKALRKRKVKLLPAAAAVAKDDAMTALGPPPLKGRGGIKKRKVMRKKAGQPAPVFEGHGESMTPLRLRSQAARQAAILPLKPAIGIIKMATRNAKVGVQ